MKTNLLKSRCAILFAILIAMIAAPMAHGQITSAPLINIFNHTVFNVVHEVTVEKVNCGGIPKKSRLYSVSAGNSSSIDFAGFVPAPGNTAPTAGDEFASISVYDECMAPIGKVGIACAGLPQVVFSSSSCHAGPQNVSIQWTNLGNGNIRIDIN